MKAAAKQEEQAATATILLRFPIMVTPRDDASALEKRLRLCTQHELAKTVS